MTLKSGTEYKGEFLGIKQSKVYFIPQDKIKDYNYFTKKISLVHLLKHNGIVLISDGKWMLSEETEVIYTLVTGRRSFKLNPEYLNIKREQSCKKNSKYKVLTMPLSNDFYGIADEIKIELEDYCYVLVDNFQALKFIDSKNVRVNEITDYHLMEVGKSASVDFVGYGYAYTMNVPNKTVATSTGTDIMASLYQFKPTSIYDDKWQDFLNGFPAIWSNSIQMKKQDAMADEAGVYVMLTYFFLNVETGERQYAFKNAVHKKIG